MGSSQRHPETLIFGCRLISKQKNGGWTAITMTTPRRQGKLQTAKQSRSKASAPLGSGTNKDHSSSTEDQTPRYSEKSQGLVIKYRVLRKWDHKN